MITSTPFKRIKKDEGRERNERFRQEIAFGVEAKNDHVVKIHSHVEDDEYFYYTMALYPTTLRNIIEDESDYRVLLDYVSQLCDGLAYVHEQDVVHRDIKPENILVDKENQRLVIADFGIAHFKDSSVTRKGELLANRNYQAPEQMAKRDSRDISKPADIFALGLIITEVFTKQNARGARHKRVGEIHPALSELDLLVELMMHQDETQRITVQAARSSLKLIRKRIDTRVKEIVNELRPFDGLTGPNSLNVEPILEQAGVDLLAAKHIFEQTTDEQLSRYNSNYHCEISYRVTDELYNACVQSELYSICKAKFEYEANSDSDDSHLGIVFSQRKTELLREFKSIQSQYPLVSDSISSQLSRLALHYFRFCKDYHCEEILEVARRELSTSTGVNSGSLYDTLIDAPILWIAKSVRRYLKTDTFERSSRNLHQIEFERRMKIDWEETNLEDSARTDVGFDLLDSSDEEEAIAPILEVLQGHWDVSTVNQGDSSYEIHFNSYKEYEKFRHLALTAAAHHHIFEGDVLDLLRPDEIYNDLVAFIWSATFDIPNTLAKILGLREI